jgi:hypothetical protein
MTDEFEVDVTLGRSIGTCLSNYLPNFSKASPDGMGVPRQHRLDAMAGDFSQISIVDA